MRTIVDEVEGEMIVYLHWLRTLRTRWTQVTWKASAKQSTNRDDFISGGFAPLLCFKDDIRGTLVGPKQRSMKEPVHATIEVDGEGTIQRDAFVIGIEIIDLSCSATSSNCRTSCFCLSMRC